MTSTTTQCRICGLPKDAQRDVADLLSHKATRQEIADHITEEYGVSCSEASVRRHIKNHMKADISKIQEDPKAKEKFVINDDGTGVVETRGYAKPIDTGLISNLEDMMRRAGVDPDAFEPVGDAGVSSWNSAAFDREKGEFVTVTLYSYRIKVRRRSDNKIHLPTLWAEAKNSEKHYKDEGLAEWEKELLEVVKTDDVPVFPFSDPQIGKDGSLGGTKELVERVEAIREQVGDKVSRMRPEHSVFMDGGDIIEGFENVAAQSHTNDLSLMDQIDLAATIEFDMIRTLADNSPKVSVMGVPSNHAAWRRGKDYLGKPGDDFGLFILKQVKKQFEMSDNYRDRITFYFPEEWDNSLNLEVNGYGLGLAHGDQANNPEGVTKWWANQVHGNQPIARSDILVTGHFHHFRMMPSGVNRYGKSKWWLQAPTLDNGSDWYRNKSGESSDPGLLTFNITKDRGLDIGSVDILSAD